MLNYGLAAAVIAMLLIASDSIVSKYLLKRFSIRAYAVMILAIGVLPMLIAQLLIGGSYNMSSNLLTIALGGIFLAIGYVFYYISISREQVSKVIIFSNLQTLIVFVFGILFLGENVLPIPLIGALLIFIGSSIGLYKKGLRIEHSLLPAVFANVSWGVYWVFMALSITTSNYIMPILLARALASVIMFIYYVLGRSSMPVLSKSKNRRSSKQYLFAVSVILVLLAATIDSGINIAFSLAISLAYAALGSAVISIAPILTAVMGRIAFKDRLNAFQKAGLILVVLGAVFIAV